MAQGPLAGRYGGVVLDCDGVLYLRDQVIASAPPALRGIRSLGVRVAFVTNNSAVPPADVARRLERLGVQADPAEVSTSAQAVVGLLGGRERLDGVRVLVLGGEGLREALARAGAALLGPQDDWRSARIVAVGLDTGLTYDRVRRAALAIDAGARFVGSNPDGSLPTPEGPWPGAGSLLAMLEAATGRRAEVAGKPEPPLLETAARSLGDGPFLMVGDRADTDVAAARRLGWDSALVLTGATATEDLPDLVAVPTWLLRDLGGLLGPVPAAVRHARRDELDAAGRLLAGHAPPGEAGARAGRSGGGDRGPAEQPASRRAVLVAATAEGLTGAVAWSLEGDRATLDGPVVVPAARGALAGTRLLVAACAAARAAGARRAGAAGPAGFLGPLGFRPGADGRRARPLAPPGQRVRGA
ncbi:MAG TPA: HAD-IIA family hydrolase [Actinomycetes bacterium]|nr:HAD-IIA family hydrolase [Actinomycetes bacterium]